MNALTNVLAILVILIVGPPIYILLVAILVKIFGPAIDWILDKIDAWW